MKNQVKVKTFDVVMLPIEVTPGSFLSLRNDRYGECTNILDYKNEEHFDGRDKPHQLYFLSKDDKIKCNDWYFNRRRNAVLLCDSLDNAKALNELGDKKVVAANYVLFEGVPHLFTKQIPNAFIMEYLNVYNSIQFNRYVKLITEVNLELDDYGDVATRSGYVSIVNGVSKILTFGELKPGEHFVDFPTDGDDSGHGGFRAGSYVFEKTEPTPTKLDDIFENAVRKMDGVRSTFPDTMFVYKVILPELYSREEAIAFIYDVLKATGGEIKAEMKNIRIGVPYIEYSGEDVEKWIDSNVKVKVK